MSSGIILRLYLKYDADDLLWTLRCSSPSWGGYSFGISSSAHNFEPMMVFIIQVNDEYHHELNDDIHNSIHHSIGHEFIES